MRIELTPEENYSSLIPAEVPQALRIIARGVKHEEVVKSGLHGSITARTAPTFRGGGIGLLTPDSKRDQIVSTLQQVEEIDTGIIYYRLGHEFHTLEALELMTKSSNPEVRKEAYKRLTEILNSQENTTTR